MALDFTDKVYNITGQLNIVEISFKQRYLRKDVRDQVRSDCADLSRMIHGLLKSVRQNTVQRTQNR